tara:strand:+ start:219 stop:722 length:504 start_codon:yes stop_codon:yes gene_type:complete
MAAIAVGVGAMLCISSSVAAVMMMGSKEKEDPVVPLGPSPGPSTPSKLKCNNTYPNGISVSEAVTAGAYVNVAADEPLYAKVVLFTGEVAGHNGVNVVSTVANLPAWEMFHATSDTFHNRLGYISGEPIGDDGLFTQILPTQNMIDTQTEYYLNGNYQIVGTRHSNC